MNRDEARRVLALLRSGERDKADPFFADALSDAARDPELMQWLEQEQEFDRVLSAKLQSVPVPPGLRTRILATSNLPRERGSIWLRRGALAAAAIVLLALIFGATRRPSGTLDDFRGEMISFVKLAPPLELESADLDRIQDFLATAKAPAPGERIIPGGLGALDPAGCRVLSFRGHKVTLICFKRGNGKLAHLFVLDRAALPRLPRGSSPTFEREGEWMTAAWQEGEQAFILAAQGDRELLEQYLNRS